jgi:hypothetical protein
MERGITKLRIIDLERLASALGHTLDYFVNDMPSPPLSHQQLKRLIRGIPVAIPIVSQEAWLQQPQEVLGMPIGIKMRLAKEKYWVSG